MQKLKLTGTFLLTIAAFMTFAMSSAFAKDASDDSNAPVCSNNSLRGTYGYSFNGTVPTWGLLAGQGTLAFSGSGNLSGAYIENVSGLLFQGKFSGSFTVAADCTGSATITGLLHTWTVQLHFVIVDGGKEVLLLDTGAGMVVSGSAKKI